MSYQTTMDVLNEFREAQTLLRESHADLRSDADSETLRYLVEHIRAWEEVMRKTLEELDKQMDASTASTFQQATPHGSPVDRVRDHLPAPREPAELANWSLKRHEELAEWCATLGQQSPNDRTADLFNSLAGELRGINRQLAADTRSLQQG